MRPYIGFHSPISYTAAHTHFEDQEVKMDKGKGKTAVMGEEAIGGIDLNSKVSILLTKALLLMPL